MLFDIASRQHFASLSPTVLHGSDSTGNLYKIVVFCNYATFDYISKSHRLQNYRTRTYVAEPVAFCG